MQQKHGNITMLFIYRTNWLLYALKYVFKNKTITLNIKFIVINL